LDGLRLALLILGIVVVAVVYFWTSRRRRYEREAGEFDRFDAWTNEDLDPLAPPGADPDRGLAEYDDVGVDADELTQPNLRLSAIRRALGRNGGEAARSDDGLSEESVESAPVAEADGAGERGAKVQGDEPDEDLVPAEVESTSEAPVIDDLEHVAASTPERVAPQVGSLDEIELDSPPLGPSIAAPAEPYSSPMDDEAGRLPTASAAAVESSPGVPKPSPQAQEQSQVRNQAAEGEAPLPTNSSQADDVQDAAELVVVLNVMAASGETFEGPALRLALENAGLKPGDMQLYHYRTQAQSADSAPIFSALNAVKPGTLDADEFDGMRTPGIAMVLRMHGIERPSEAFELMLGAARSIADELGGQVCDETRSTLTGQALNHLRERVTTAAFRALSGS
jgi:cell division protein ZipA